MQDDSCHKKRELATATMDAFVLVSGDTWQTAKDIKVYSDSRPHLYYMVQLDCKGNF